MVKTIYIYSSSYQRSTSLRWKGFGWSAMVSAKYPSSREMSKIRGKELRADWHEVLIECSCEVVKGREDQVWQVTQGGKRSRIETKHKTKVRCEVKAMLKNVEDEWAMQRGINGWMNMSCSTMSYSITTQPPPQWICRSTTTSFADGVTNSAILSSLSKYLLCSSSLQNCHKTSESNHSTPKFPGYEETRA